MCASRQREPRARRRPSSDSGQKSRRQLRNEGNDKQCHNNVVIQTMKHLYHSTMAPLTMGGQFDAMSHQRQAYDYWYQAGPSNSWSADSTSSTSDSSTSFDSNHLEESPTPSLRDSQQRRGRNPHWRPRSAAVSPMYSPGYGTPPTSKRKVGNPPPKTLPEFAPGQCVALDAEMVGVGEYGEDSSVARVVVVNWDGEVLFDEYIKQTQPVTDYRTFVSGITPDHLCGATLTLRDARKRILKIIYGRFLIGHALKNDLQALGISHPWWLIRDTARYEPFMQQFLPDATFWPRKLKDLSLELLGNNIQTYGKPHSPYEDAMAAMNLYKLVRMEWERLMQKKVSKTNEIQAEERIFMKKLARQQHEWARQQQAAYVHMHQQMMWQQQQYASIQSHQAS